MATCQDGLEILAFADAAKWRSWLALNHATHPGLWMMIAKKGAPDSTLTTLSTLSYAQALDEALCYGWIDGQKGSLDAHHFLQRFTRRRPRSIWSKVNIAHVARLSEAGRMSPAGLAEVDRAKAEGRWERAYDAPSTSKIPDDFLALLDLPENKKAKVFYGTLKKAELYSIAWRLQTAKKAETRARRMEAILAMLANKETFHFFNPKDKAK